MICQYTVTVTISWSLSKLTRTWYTAFANIEPVSRSVPIWYSLCSHDNWCRPYYLVLKYILLPIAWMFIYNLQFLFKDTSGMILALCNNHMQYAIIMILVWSKISLYSPLTKCTRATEASAKKSSEGYR
jgi:hypothetical protein